MSVDFSAILMEGYVFNDNEMNIREALTTFFRMIEENGDSLFVQAIDIYYEDSNWFHSMLNNCTCAAEVADAYAEAAFDYLLNQDYLRYGADLVYIGQIISEINEYSDNDYISIKNLTTGFDSFSPEIKEFLSAMFPQIVKNPPELLLISYWS